MQHLYTAAKQTIISLFFVLVIGSAKAQLKLDITSFELSNGLKVILNRDTTFNEVALYLFADAGFKKEAAGQHGMAHLFEHVMLPTRYFHNSELSRNAGQHSINSNAQVFNDFVRYYLHYDKNGLDYGLISLADRLDFQIDSLTDEGLKRHINNVVSEISQSESFGSFRWRPVFRDALAKNIFGSSHPYGHEQSLTDITKATKTDVQNWFRQWFGAGNAMLMVLGNVHPDSLRSKVETYFSNIDPGRQSFQQDIPVPTFGNTRKVDISFNGDKHVVYYGWAVPGYGTREDDYFRLLASLLAHPSTGILTKALKAAGIENAKAFSSIESYKDASVFDAGVEFSNGKDKEKVEALIREEIKKLTVKPLASQNLQSAYNGYRLSFMKSIEDIGLNDERITELGKGALFLNNPLYFEVRLDRLKNLTPAQLEHTSAKWLSHPPYIATINGRKLGRGKTAYDFKKSIPFVAPSSPVTLPIVQKKLTPNLTVHAVKLSRIPVVNFLVAFENSMGLPAVEMVKYKEAVSTFFESDPAFTLLQVKGLETEARITAKNIIYKVSVSRETAPQVYDWLAKKLSSFTSLEKNLKASDPSSHMEKTLTVLQQVSLPVLSSPLSYPLSRIHLIAVGDLHPERSFDWNRLSAQSALFTENTSAVTAQSDAATLFIKNIGESPTSFLTLGHYLKPADIKEEMYQQLLVHILRSKLMANLREKNGLAYEIYPYSTTPAGKGSLGFWQTSVAVEKTERALQEIAVELEGLPNDLERRVAAGKTRVMAELKSGFKSLSAIENTVVETIEYDRPADYLAQAVQALNAIEPVAFVQFVKTKARPEHFKIALFTTPKLVKELTTKDTKIKVLE